MPCILAFIIFLILFPVLGIFPKYRRLFKKSWKCVLKKVTFQPCDIDLTQELKGKIIGKLFKVNPKLAGFFNKTFSYWAFGFVLVNIISILILANGLLNLWVHDTCSPQTGESCSLSGQACGIANENLSLGQALAYNQFGKWAVQPIVNFSSTLALVPDRLKKFESSEYLSQNPTYLRPYDQTKKTAVEFIDPGCQYCRELYQNIKNSNFLDKYNLTYVSYPIPKTKGNPQAGYKFQASKTLSSYLEAMKNIKPENSENSVSGDWQFLDYLFTLKNGMYPQSLFNYEYTPDEFDLKIFEILIQIGYSPNQANQIAQYSKSAEIENILKYNSDLVENRLKSVRIPTIIINGRKYGQVLSVEKLNKK